MNPPASKKLTARLRPLWRKLGGASLSISVAFHVVVLIVACFWAMRVVSPRIEAPEPINFMTTGGGGGDPALLESHMREQHLNFTAEKMERISAKDVVSNIAFPEPFNASSLKSPFPDSAALRSAGLGGNGVGGGMGSGRGKGFGDGTGIGSGKGNGMKNPFGALNPGESTLTGTFYNLNRNKDETPRPTGYPEYERLTGLFVNGNWNPDYLRPYFEAPTKLYISHLYMPVLDARAAPRAFRQTPEFHPRWMLLYEGTVVAPKTGRFRFVGAGDDVLMVRFNKRNVFDHGYLEPSGIVPPAPTTLANGVRGTAPSSRKVEKSAFYIYDSTLDWNGNLRGLAAGAYFEVTEGAEYPIQILIGEGQGGLFAAALLIEEFGASYEKTGHGVPIFPIFRTDPAVPMPTNKDNAPPYDPRSPVWKVVRGKEKI